MSSYMVNSAGKRVCHRGHIMTKNDIYVEVKKSGHKLERCKHCRKEAQIRFKAKRPLYYRQKNAEWRITNKLRREQYETTKRSEYRVQWIAYFKKHYGIKPKCQLCEKRLFWTHARHDLRVCLDHRTGNEAIKSRSPRTWIQNKPCDNKHIQTFVSCNFGILCRACNILMSSDIKRRKKISCNLLRYIKESGI